MHPKLCPCSEHAHVPRHRRQSQASNLFMGSESSPSWCRRSRGSSSNALCGSVCVCFTVCASASASASASVSVSGISASVSVCVCVCARACQRSPTPGVTSHDSAHANHVPEKPA
eukprot:5962653-Amphidinium_carterae.1